MGIKSKKEGIAAVVHHSVMSDSLWPHRLQHTDFPVLHHLQELAQTHVHWISDAIQPSRPLVIPFSSCLLSFPASESFPMSQPFTSGGQSTEASASVLPVNIQGWFPLRWTGWISLQSKGLILKSLLQHHSSKASILQHSAFLIVQLSHPYMTTGKTIALTRRTFVGKVISLLFFFFNFILFLNFT